VGKLIHCVGNLVLLAAVKEFRKSIKNWQNLRSFLWWHAFLTHNVHLFAEVRHDNPSLLSFSHWWS